MRKNVLEPWDRRINREADVTDVDLIVFREYMQRMGLWNRSKPLEDYFSPKEKIADFTPPLVGRPSMINSIKLRNFTILMFGKPLQFFDGVYAVYSVYRGTDRSERTGERLDITGNVVMQAKEGQGIPTIFRVMKESGNPPPRFEVEAASVTCILPAHPRHRLLTN